MFTPTCVSAALLYGPIQTYQSRAGDRQTHPTFPLVASLSSSFHWANADIEKAPKPHSVSSVCVCICIHPLFVFAMLPLRAQRNPPPCPPLQLLPFLTNPAALLILCAASESQQRLISSFVLDITVHISTMYVFVFVFLCYYTASTVCGVLIGVALLI